MVRLLVVSPLRLSLAIYSANASSDCSGFVCRGFDCKPLIQGWRVLDQTCCFCPGVPDLLRVRLAHYLKRLLFSINFMSEYTSYVSDCSMTTDGGGWNMCYTTRGQVRLSLLCVNGIHCF